MAIVDLEEIPKVQPMREGEINTVDTVNAMLSAFPLKTDDIADAAITNAKLGADSVTTDKIQDGTINTSDIADSAITNTKLAADSVTNDKILDGTIALDKLVTSLQFIQNIPALEYGTSNSFSVSASSYYDVTVTFGDTKTEAPVIFCGIQHSTGNLNCITTQVTNQQFAVRVYNLTTTDIDNVTLDWLALSGR